MPTDLVPGELPTAGTQDDVAVQPSTQIRRKPDRANPAERRKGGAQPSGLTATAPAGGEPSFRFEIANAALEPLTAPAPMPLLRARLRHFHNEPIALGPRTRHALGVGIRVWRDGESSPVFDDRMVPQEALIAPGEWSELSVRLPLWVFGATGTARITIDMLKEGEFWFSPAGQPAVDVVVSLKSGPGVAGSVSLHSERGRMTEESQAFTKQVVFDVSDLIHYFHHARLPTGIQRVQIEIIDSLLDDPPADCALVIACFRQQHDFWVDLPTDFFRNLCTLSLRGGATDAPEWTQALYKLGAFLSQRPRLAFAKDAFLINLGTSWWLRNYFLHVRAAKATYGIRYVPYVHDCIPVITPEHCVETLTRDYLNWLLSAFQHADHLMVNSEATAADVVRVARYLGHDIDPPAVVTLDADYKEAAAAKRARSRHPEDSDLFARQEIEAGRYVLFVSTVESRKNHLLAFSAWLTLLKKYGEERVPKLVCVGNRGWLNDAIYAKLSASKLLQRNVIMLSRISDPDLKQLYRNCRATLYPSAYEGWGLPVTESLCYGKVPVLANTSSLPEAGGPFAEYFDPGSERELVEALERILFDDGYRRAREAEIVAKFRPRSWAAIGEQIVGLIRGWAAQEHPAGGKAVAAGGVLAFPAKLGHYYGLAEILETELKPQMQTGEIYRQGEAWWWPEEWGCWTKADVAKLAFAAPTNKALVVYLALRGVQARSSRATIQATGAASVIVPLKSEQDCWLMLRIAPANGRKKGSAQPRVVEISVSADAAADFSERTAGEDKRIASVGVRGFMVCEADDTAARLRALESLMALQPGQFARPKPIS